jgi:hypothetical protein
MPDLCEWINTIKIFKAAVKISLRTISEIRCVSCVRFWEVKIIEEPLV